MSDACKCLLSSRTVPCTVPTWFGIIGCRSNYRAVLHVSLCLPCIFTQGAAYLCVCTSSCTCSCYMPNQVCRFISGWQLDLLLLTTHPSIGIGIGTTFPASCGKTDRRGKNTDMLNCVAEMPAATCEQCMSYRAVLRRSSLHLCYWPICGGQLADATNIMQQRVDYHIWGHSTGVSLTQHYHRSVTLHCRCDVGSTWGSSGDFSYRNTFF